MRRVGGRPSQLRGQEAERCPGGSLDAGKSGIRTVSERAVDLVLYDRFDIEHHSPVTVGVGDVTRLRVR